MRFLTLAFLASLLLSINHLPAQVNISYLWHLQQPNYWPEQSTTTPYGYQKVQESQALKTSGGNVYPDNLAHPLNDLQQIFSKPDRVAVYQYRTKDAVQSLLSHPNGGAQVNYSGCLIENINSLASNNQWGYSTNWNNNFSTARGWTTSNGKPRMDITGFTFHHALSPLLTDACLSKQIQAHKLIYGETFGTAPNYSKGYWPAECSFSERIIKVLVQEGFEWSIVANSHLARTLNDYPVVYGTNGCNISPPNLADQVPANGTNWWSGQIDGRGGQFAAPYCYQAHKAKYVDPASGTDYVMTVVPMADLLSYQNGFSTMGTGEIDQHIAPYNNNAQPCLVLMAHDGDNAWGGGYDYYNNSVPGLANAAASQGYTPSTVQQFLTDYPVPTNDLVHVEDGSWFNAANDWGHPQFINWLWPMYNTSYRFDPNGWTEDARNWAVLVAAENRVQMAEDLSNGVSIQKIVHPDANASQAEMAWHHLLPGFTSGYMYYGTSLDMEVKQSLAANLATDYADQVITASTSPDLTPPTVFIPQRFPYNPGGTGYGPIYGYQQVQNSSDFHVWTFAYDASGITQATLKYRTDFDGSNPLSDNDNDTYAGGSGVSAWQDITMSVRNFPTGNVTNNGDIDFFITPDYMADEFYAEIAGLSDTLVDYYIEVTDLQGNVTQTPIQHVYVGGSSAGPGANAVYWTPSNPGINDTITVHVPNPPTGGRLHWGVDGWNQVDNVYWPAGSALFQGTGPAIQTPMLGPLANELTLKIGPFNQTAQTVNTVDFVINFDDNTWDNNNGQDYHIFISQPVASEGPTNLSVEVGPIPAKDELKINLPFCSDPAFDLQITDVQGKSVLRQSIGCGLTTLDVQTLPAGVYFLQIRGTQTHKSYTKKLIKG